MPDAVGMTPEQVRSAEFLKEFKRAREMRSRQEGQWRLNHAFFIGDHYLDWNASNGTYTRVRGSEYEIQVVMNYFYNVVRTTHAKITTGQRVEARVEPLSGDERKRIARIGKHLCRQWFDSTDNGVADTYSLASLMGMLFPAWLYVTPEQMGTIEKEIPVMDTDPETGMEIPGMRAESKPDYEVRVEFIMPFDVWAIPGSNNSIYKRWKGIIVKKRITETDAAALFPPEEADRAKNLPHGVAGDKDPILDLVMGGDNTAAADPDLITIYERWERPCPQYPEGRFEAFDANHQLLASQDFLPFHLKRLPFVPLYEQNAVGQYQIDTSRQLREIQKEVNRNYNRLFEGARKHSHPKLMLPQRSIRPNTKLTKEPGQIVQLNTGITEANGPYYLQPPRLYQGLPVVIENLLVAMERIAGVSEVSARGVLPVRAQTLGQTNAILQQEGSRLDSIRENRENALAELFSIYLSYCQKIYPFEKIVRIVGDDARASTEKWTSEDIDDDFLVTVKIGNRFGADAGTRISLAQALIGQQPILGNPVMPPADRKMLMEILELGDVGSLDPNQKQRQFAEWECSQMARGVPLEPHPEDTDPLIHLPVERDFLVAIIMGDMEEKEKAMGIAALSAHIRDTQIMMLGGLPKAATKEDDGDAKTNGRVRKESVGAGKGG